MSTQDQNKRPKPKCYECGKELEGSAGVHYHKIKHGITRYYCLECLKKLQEGR